MKFWHSSHTFEHPWSTVTQAFWRKYPNDYQTVVYGTDTIDRFVAPDGKLHSTRLIISDWNIPGFMKFFFGDARGYAVEYSIVDPVKQTLTLKSQNINAASMFKMREDIVYKSVGETTSLEHEAKILFSASRLFDDAAENWLFDTLTVSACKGLKAMDSVIDKVEVEMQSAIATIDELSSETRKSVDLLATDAFKSIDSSISDAEKFIDDAEKFIDSSISDAEKFIDDAEKFIDGSVDSIKTVVLSSKDS